MVERHGTSRQASRATSLRHITIVLLYSATLGKREATSTPSRWSHGAAARRPPGGGSRRPHSTCSPPAGTRPRHCRRSPMRPGCTCRPSTRPSDRNRQFWRRRVSSRGRARRSGDITAGVAVGQGAHGGARSPRQLAGFATHIRRSRPRRPARGRDPQRGALRPGSRQVPRARRGVAPLLLREQCRDARGAEVAPRLGMLEEPRGRDPNAQRCGSRRRGAGAGRGRADVGGEAPHLPGGIRIGHERLRPRPSWVAFRVVRAGPRELARGGEDGGLRAEGLVDRLHVQTSGVGDRLQRRRRVPAGREQLERGVGDLRLVATCHCAA